MNISIKAQITLTLDEIKEALTQYVSANGFDLEGKDVEFSEDLPEVITLVADGTDQPKATHKPKAKTKAKPAEVKPAVMPEPEPVEPAPVVAELKAEEPVEDIPPYKQPASEAERARASAEAQAAIEASQALLNNNNKPEDKPVNVFAALKGNSDVAEDDDVIEDQPIGQDVLDNPEVLAEDTPVEETKPTGKRPNLFADPTPAPTVQPTTVRTKVAANRLFG